MESFRGYDDWKCSAPEDERGYYQDELASHSGLSHAEVLLIQARRAAAALAGTPSATITIGGLLPDVAEELAELAGVKVEVRPYEPGPYLREACRYGSGPYVLFSVAFRHMGVGVEGFGTRPAIAAEIADAVTK